MNKKAARAEHQVAGGAARLGNGAKHQVRRKGRHCINFLSLFFFNPAFDDDKQAGAELGQAQVVTTPTQLQPNLT